MTLSYPCLKARQYKKKKGPAVATGPYSIKEGEEKLCYSSVSTRILCTPIFIRTMSSTVALGS